MSLPEPKVPQAPSGTLRRVGRAAAVVVLVIGVLLGGVKWRYGGGVSYPGVATPAAAPEGALRVLVELPLPPGNVTTSRKTGRVFFNTHPFVVAHRFTDAFLFELVDGVPRPYPSPAAQPDLRFVFGMTVDAQERLWVVSPATLDRSRTRLQAFDLSTDTRVFDHELPAGVARFGQDLRVTPDGRALVLADTGAFRFTAPSLVVVSLPDFRHRRVLVGHPSTSPQDWSIRTASGPYRIGGGLLTFSVGVDGVAIGPDGTWLYFGAMSHDTLHRVRLQDVLDEALPEAELERRVERVGQKPLSDGIEALADGSVLITDVENGGLARLSADGVARTLVRDPRVVWADGVAVTRDGVVLFTDSAIPAYIDPLLRPPSRERLAAGAPYRVFALTLPQE